MTPPDTAIADQLSAVDSSDATATLSVRPRGPIATIRKYVKIYRASLVERMTYRGDFLLVTFLRFLPMITTILLWRAIYSSSGLTRLAGFTYSEMIAYL